MPRLQSQSRRCDGTADDGRDGAKALSDRRSCLDAGEP